MNCQDLRHLLAFVNRASAELDAAERDAIKQHLDKCPDCAEMALAERRGDEAVGVVLRDVAVPVGLKQKVIARLAAERAAVPWKWAGTIVLAASLLVAASVIWYLRPLPELTAAKLFEQHHRGPGMKEAEVEKYFADQGLPVQVPTDFVFDPYLRRVEVVEFEKRRVAKLVFFKDMSTEEPVQATVLIIPDGQFKTDRLPERESDGLINLLILRKDGFTYVIFYRGRLELLRQGMT